jgi:Acyltransferase family
MTGTAPPRHVGTLGVVKPDNKHPFPTVVRTVALTVVVIWHGALSTLRWDENGPLAGNPLHLVPAGFVLTWFLQVMPMFFLIGGAMSLESLQRHRDRTGCDSGWVGSRLRRLALPSAPLLLIAAPIAIWGSPSTVGTLKLALSPLWFLAVYMPITALTPTFIRLHERRKATFAIGLVAVTAVLHVARHVVGPSNGVLWCLTLLSTWSVAYAIGFHLDHLRKSAKTSVTLGILGVVIIFLGMLSGLPGSMVALRHESVSNMGDVTPALLGLIIFQAGLLGLAGDRIVRLSQRQNMARLVSFVDRNQTTIFVGHLPLWTLVALGLRSTPFAVSEQPTAPWLALRPFWFAITCGCAFAPTLLHRTYRAKTVRYENRDEVDTIRRGQQTT